MSELEAGEALDALIAVQVLGCQPRQRTNWGYRTPDGSEYVTAHKRPIWPLYSTQIADAWLVVTHLQAADWSVTLHGCCCEDDGAWSCLLIPHDGAGVDADAATAPLAICQAALKTLAGEAS